MKLLSVGSLPERADGLPEPLLCSLYGAAQITRSYRNKRDGSGGGHQVAACKGNQTNCRACHYPRLPVVSWERPGAEHLAGQAAFDTDRNLLANMVALGFHEIDKIIRFQTNSVEFGGGSEKKTGDTSVVALLSPSTPRMMKSERQRNKEQAVRSLAP